MKNVLEKEVLVSNLQLVVAILFVTTVVTIVVYSIMFN